MASPHMIEVNDENFEREVLKSPEPVLVDFGATWCGPCKALEPIVAKLAEEGAGRYRVAKIDMDAAPLTVRKYGVRAAPTVMVFRGGEKRAQHVGLTNRGKLLQLLDA
jgi:thioredoxin 1